MDQVQEPTAQLAAERPKRTGDDPLHRRARDVNGCCKPGRLGVCVSGVIAELRKAIAASNRSSGAAEVIDLLPATAQQLSDAAGSAALQGLHQAVRGPIPRATGLHFIDQSVYPLHIPLERGHGYVTAAANAIKLRVRKGADLEGADFGILVVVHFSSDRSGAAQSATITGTLAHHRLQCCDQHHRSSISNCRAGVAPGHSPVAGGSGAGPTMACACNTAYRRKYDKCRHLVTPLTHRDAKDRET